MAVIQSGNDATQLLRITPYSKSARVSAVPIGPGYAFSGITGTIAATTNGALFAMRLDPSALLRAYITKLVLQWTTIVAFTVPVTAGRRIVATRANGAAATSGTLIIGINKKDSGDAVSEMAAAQGGDMRISNTAALTATGITYDTADLAIMSIVDLGAAGSYKAQLFEWDGAGAAPIVILPGELFIVRTAAALDAGGTGQLAVQVEWFELNPHL